MPAIQVPAQGAKHARDRGGAHGRGFLAKRVEKLHWGSLGKAAGLGGINHGARNRFTVAQTYQPPGNGQLFLAERVAFDPRRRGADARRQPIVAVDARNFLNEVHLTRHIGPPGGCPRAPTAFLLSLHFKTQGAQNALRFCGRNLSAKNAKDFPRAQHQPHAGIRTRIYIEKIRQNFAPGEFGNHRSRAISGERRYLNVSATFEMVRGFRVHAVSFRRAADGNRLEPGALQQHRTGGWRNFGILAAHNPREGHRQPAVGNHQVL